MALYAFACSLYQAQDLQACANRLFHSVAAAGKYWGVHALAQDELAGQSQIMEWALTGSCQALDRKEVRKVIRTS